MIWAVIGGYLLGSISWGLIFCKLADKPDPRTIGSGNVGTTNVLRAGGKIVALFTLLFDSGKGAVAVILSMLFLDDSNIAMISGLMVIIGHNFPVWLGFNGGKGVATTLGIYIALSPIIGAIACLTWLLVFLLFRYSSLAALVALVIAPISIYGLYDFSILDSLYFMVFALVLSILCCLMHRQNIMRLIRREEPKITFAKFSK